MIYQTFPCFSPYSRRLRQHFDQCFADPHFSRGDRFVWDFWHIPNEYTFVRTPAFQYFPEKLYKKFHTHLVQWGRDELGCHDVSPTWLSYYVNGCQQSLHQDQPHGPLAFVLSLTKSRSFRGGNTIILKSEISRRKSYWSIPPVFNRLIVFDPSLLHGVDPVSGVQDPRKARLVLHGWFVNPRVFWYGKLNAPIVDRVLREQLSPFVQDLRDVEGFCSWRLKIANQGKVEHVQLLMDTLKGERATTVRRLRAILAHLQFPKGRRSTLTIPLGFSES